ncbi:MAG: SEL1-like repeat protein [Prevotella sp.]|nr:SEL1-like repeat protein [Prevotella sp.]
MKSFLRTNNVSILWSCMLVIATVVLNVTSASGQIRRQPFSSLTKPEQKRLWKSRVERANRVLKGIDESKTKDWAINVLETAVTEDSSALAMNSLGIAYLQGNGVKADSIRAVSWFERAGQHGYAYAYYHLGALYRFAMYGVEQNFKKAYDYFSLGAEKGSTDCMYVKGMMLYKGTGCHQNYTEAFQCFKDASEKRHRPSLYMIGLCYRNGYGVGTDSDLATEYLYRSAMLGYRDAKEELERPNPENYLENLYTDGNIPDEMPQISPTVNDTSLIAGCYHGYLATYDWSGKYLIGEKPMSMIVRKKGAEVTGQMVLGTDTVPFTANLTEDNRLDFMSGSLKMNDRYTTSGAVKYRLTNVLYDVWNEKIRGRLNLYSLSQKEPERPMFFELKRDGMQTLLQQDNKNNIAIMPNPFEKSFTINLELQESSPVKVRIFNVNGIMVWQQDYGQQNSGACQLIVNPAIKPGRYVLNIMAGIQIFHSLVVKEGGAQ